MDLANHLSAAAVNSGLSAAALRVRRSAILKTCTQVNPERAIPLATSSDVIRAVNIRRARQRARIPAWDLRLVLDFLTGPQFEPPESAPLRELTRKAAFLVMLACGRRASEIHGLSGLASDVRRERDGSFSLQFLPEFLAKNQAPDELSPALRIRPLSHIADDEDSDIRLCPVRILRAYLRRTRDRRTGPLRRLFLPCSLTRHRDIIKSTLSRWISSVIKDAYAELATHGVAGSSSAASESGGVARGSDSAHSGSNTRNQSLGCYLGRGSVFTP